MISLSLCLLSSFLPIPNQAVGGDFSELRTWRGFYSSDNYGDRMEVMEDVDGDGIQDHLIAGSTAQAVGGIGSGLVDLYSGADGTLIHRWEGAQDRQYFGSALTGIPDVNSDGVPDVLIGMPGYAFSWTPPGSAFVYSGSDGTLIRRLDGPSARSYFGQAVASVGDHDGDGVADFLIGAPKHDIGGLEDVGIAYLYSGATGLVLQEFPGFREDDEWGSSLCNAGDMDGDGVTDFVIGSGTAHIGPGAVMKGKLVAVHGATLLPMFQWTGTRTYEHFGRKVLGPGDMNGDGHADVVVFASPNFAYGLSSPGLVSVYSGFDGSLLHEWVGLEWDRYGSQLEGLGDFNGDGCADVMIGSWEFNPGFVDVRSGKSGAILHRFEAPYYADSFASAVSSAGDIDGDGRPEILISDAYSVGVAYLYDFDPYLLADQYVVSAQTGGTIQLDLNFPQAAAGLQYMVLMSVAGTGPSVHSIRIPLTNDSFYSNSARQDYPFGNTQGMHGTLDSQGNATASITIPPYRFRFGVGHTFHLAAIATPDGILPTYSSIAATFTFSL